MKNTIKLTFGVLLTFAIFISCTKNEGDVKLNQGFIESSKYGEYHNELLKSYNNKNGKAKDFIALYDELNLLFNDLHKDKLTYEENKFYKNRLIKVGDGNFEITPRNYQLITIKGIKLFYEGKTEMVLLDLFQNPSNPKIVIKALNELLNDRETPEVEKNEIEKMLIAYKSSMEYWTNRNFDFNKKNNPVTDTYACDPMDQVFFADAVGCMFGGLGSVGYSWAIYSMQGGRCL